MCLSLRLNVILDLVSLVFLAVCLLSLSSAMNSPDRRKPKKANLKAVLMLTSSTCVEEA
jgi:hypothetical protein